MTSTNNLPTIYLRFKRQNQTIFMECKANEILADVVHRLASLLGLQENDIRCYEVMSEERRKDVIRIEELKQLELLKQQRKKNLQWIPNNVPTSTANATSTAASANGIHHTTSSSTATSSSSTSASTTNDGITTGTASSSSNIVIPPYDDKKKIRDLGLENDSPVFFVIKQANGEFEASPV
jgi:activator of HSP90 ATPase